MPPGLSVLSLGLPDFFWCLLASAEGSVSKASQVRGWKHTLNRQEHHPCLVFCRRGQVVTAICLGN